MDERTAHIIGLFKDSWIKTEEFYVRLLSQNEGWGRLSSLLEAIRLWKQQGLDSHFRLGTSIHYLIISRSVDHGLRKDQKYIKIECVKEDDFVVVIRDGERKYKEYKLNALNDEKLTGLIETLRHTLVD